MQRMLVGALAGCVATIPMTLLMRTWHAHLPPGERDPLPPEKITARAAHAAGIDSRPRQPGWEWKTYATHFGFGAAAGALYGMLIRPGSAAEAPARGIVWGLGVWTVSYLGWLPAIGMHRPATREPAQRNWLMVIAHVVWGGALGALTSLGERPHRSKAGTPGRLGRISPLIPARRSHRR